MPSKKLPQINLPDTNAEKWMDRITVFLILVMFAGLAIYYPQLPAEIPSHFNADGTTDSWGSKKSIWMLPILACFLTGLMFFLYKIPHYYNYMVTITEQNAPTEYRKARLLLRMTSISIALIFSIILIETCYVAIHQKTIFGSSMMILILLLSLTPIIIYFVKSKRRA